MNLVIYDLVLIKSLLLKGVNLYTFFKTLPKYMFVEIANLPPSFEF